MLGYFLIECAQTLVVSLLFSVIVYLRSIHFKKTVEQYCSWVILISFKIVVLFNINQNKKYHNFGRNEDRATVFLKWRDFKKFDIFISRFVYGKLRQCLLAFLQYHPKYLGLLFVREYNTLSPLFDYPT